MPRYLLAVYRPNGFDHSVEITAEVMADIDALNDEMEAAGVRIFVGGLQPIATINAIVRSEDGVRAIHAGPAANENRYLDGFWVLDVPILADAVAWGEKASQACRATIEVRPFH